MATRPEDAKDKGRIDVTLPYNKTFQPPHYLEVEVRKDLVAPYQHTNIRVYMNKCYTGAPLLKDLASLVEHCCRRQKPFICNHMEKHIHVKSHQLMHIEGLCRICDLRAQTQAQKNQERSHARQNITLKQF